MTLDTGSRLKLKQANYMFVWAGKVNGRLKSDKSARKTKTKNICIGYIDTYLSAGSLDLVINVPAVALASNGARPAAGTVLTEQ